jgi:hypothetical protein
VELFESWRDCHEPAKAHRWPEDPERRQKSVEQGAATTVLLAASPLLEGVGGRYFEDCNEARVVFARPTDFSGGVAPYALQSANATRLWEVALKLVGRQASGN